MCGPKELLTSKSAPKKWMRRFMLIIFLSGQGWKPSDCTPMVVIIYFSGLPPMNKSLNFYTTIKISNMNASSVSFLDALSSQGTSHQSQYLPAGLILKASTSLVSVQNLNCETTC